MSANVYHQYKEASSIEKGQEILLSHFDNASIEKIKFVNFFGIIKGHRITLNGERKFFPKFSEGKQKENEITHQIRSIFLEVNLIIPTYIPIQSLRLIASIILDLSDTEKEKFLNDYLRSIYSEDFMASFCIHVYTKKLMESFRDHIIESIEAYYLGNYKTAIITLIPCIEGLIGNIGKKVGLSVARDLRKTDILSILSLVQSQYIKSELKEYTWYPEDIIGYFDKFDERIQIIESMKFFIKNRMYQDTRNENDMELSKLNRHGIIHGFIKDFDNPCNYLRLIVFINALANVSVIAGDPGVCFFPKPTESEIKLAARFRNIRNLSSKK